MIFQHTIGKVLSGEKTQTRRIRRPMEILFNEGKGCEFVCKVSSFFENENQEDRGDRIIYEVGKTYAVQPGRGKPSVARIEVTGIRQEDVRSISDDDVKAEGYKSKFYFLEAWCKMHDKPHVIKEWERPYVGNARWLELIYKRPDNRYQAWVVEFKLVQS